MKKLKNDSGSALILALFLMILVSMIIVSFSNQVANQIRSTINLDDDIKERYYAESNIEEFIADFIENIEIRPTGSTDIPQGKLGVDCGDYVLYYNQYPDTDINSQKEGNSTVNFIITIKVKDEESKVTEESKIKIIVSKINNENQYSIDYGIESWRERKIGVDSLND